MFLPYLFAKFWIICARLFWTYLQKCCANYLPQRSLNQNIFPKFAGQKFLPIFRANLFLKPHLYIVEKVIEKVKIIKYQLNKFFRFEMLLQKIQPECRWRYRQSAMSSTSIQTAANCLIQVRNRSSYYQPKRSFVPRFIR